MTKTALRRELPPMIAQNLRRIDNGGTLIGKFDLYLPYWHATLRGCSWFTNHVDAAWVRVRPRTTLIGIEKTATPRPSTSMTSTLSASRRRLLPPLKYSSTASPRGSHQSPTSRSRKRP